MASIAQKGEKHKVIMASKKVAPLTPGQPGVMVKSNSWNVKSAPRSTIEMVKSSNSVPSSPRNKNAIAKCVKPKPNIKMPKGKENFKGVASPKTGGVKLTGGVASPKLAMTRGPRIVKPVVRPSRPANSSAFGSDSSSESHQVSSVAQVATFEDCAILDQMSGSPFSPSIAKSSLSNTSTPSSEELNRCSGITHRTSSLFADMDSPERSPQKLIGISQSTNPYDITPTVSPPNKNKSPLILSSRAVPDLHNKLLAKLKANKRRSRCPKVPDRSPTKCSSNKPEAEDDEEVFCGEGESDSSVGSIPRSRRPSSACSSRSDFSDSPNSEELEFLLRSMFTTCDEFRTGRVPAGKLLDYLLALVEVPSLNTWKVEELSRLLDPQQDNRYVDEEAFQEVGKKWVDMMLDPICHDPQSESRSPEQPPKAPIDDNVSASIPRSTGSHDFNISYGSIAGLGGTPAYSRDEVELENKVSELSYQLARAGEEQLALQNALSLQEDANAILCNELDSSKRKIGSLKEMVERTNLVHDELDEVKMSRSRTDEQCCNLSVQVEQLLKEKEQKEQVEEEKEQLMLQLTQCRKEIKEKERREKELLTALNEREQECSRLGVGIVEREEQLQEERDAREGMEGRLEDLSREVEKMEMELSLKDLELRNFTNNTGLSGNTSNSHSLNLSTLHDVSVDDRVLEEARVNPPPVTPSRMVRPSGPSASSTPSSYTKKNRPVSIGDEMKQLGLDSSFLSPFSEKGCDEGATNSSAGGFSCLLQTFRKEFESKHIGLAEKLRKVICGEAEAEETGRMMVALNQTMAGFSKELIEKYNVLVVQLEKTEKGKSSLTDKFGEVQDDCLDESAGAPVFDKRRIEELDLKMLEEKNQTIRELEKKLDEAKEGQKCQIIEQDLQEVEAKVKEMAGLLQVANQALLVAGQSISRENSRSGTPNIRINSRAISPQPDGSSMDLDIDSDLLNDWQHDYDGLELIEWNNNLSKKLMQYANASRLLLGKSQAQEFSLLGKSGLGIDLNSYLSSPLLSSGMVKPTDMDTSKTFKSSLLLTKLSELHQEAQRSRDLLMMASESMREDVSMREEMSMREEANATQNHVAPSYPKTVACQTVEVVEEMQEEAVEDDETVEEAWWPRFLTRLVCAILLGLVYFTFCCGIEIEGVEYYPCTWYPLRRLFWLPDPLVTIRYRRLTVPLVW